MPDRVLVIGSGSIGRRHASNLIKLGWRDIVIYDPAPESLEKAPKQCKKETDFSRALGSGCGIALVCSPPHLHVQQAMECLERGMHVFIEKPISHNLAGVDGLIALAKKKNLTIMTACNLRFSKAFAKVKELVDSGRLGKVLGVCINFGSYLPGWRPQADYRANYAARPETGGGVILDAGIHEIDFVRWLLGPARLHSAYARKQSDLEIQTEDYADMILQHHNGAVSSIHVDYLNREYTHKGMVICERGTIQWDFAKNTVTVNDGTARKFKEFGSGSANEMYVEEMKHFLKCARTGEKPLADAEDGRNALRIALSAKKMAGVCA